MKQMDFSSVLHEHEMIQPVNPARSGASFMRWIVSTSILAVLLGCTSTPHSTENSRTAQTAYEPADGPGQIPLAQIQAIPSRTRLLKKGMTEEQVFRTLGLYDVALAGNASGPAERSVRAYELRPGYGLNLVFDTTTSPAKFLAVRLEGQGWKRT
jgi:hypothetical protein